MKLIYKKIIILLCAGLLAGIGYLIVKNLGATDMAITVDNCAAMPSMPGCASLPAASSAPMYAIAADQTAVYTPNAPQPFAFTIIDNQGNILKDFAITHEKLMHFIVVRKDLQGFQHLHPEYNAATGLFTISNLNFPLDGQYRLFADFAPMSPQKDAHGNSITITISKDVVVGDMAQYQAAPIGSEATIKKQGEYEFSLAASPTPLSAQSNTMLAFEVRKNGKLVTDLEPYLGALGHSIVFSQNDLEFIHVHPADEINQKQTGTVAFAVSFPKAGMYKVFTQFQHQGKIFTIDFVVPVTKAVGSSPAPHH